MFVQKVSTGVYQVRVTKHTRPLYRGTLSACVAYMKAAREAKPE